MTRAKNTHAVDAVIARMLAGGCTCSEIADALDLTQDEIRQRLSLMRLPVPHNRMMPPCRLCPYYRACLNSVIRRGPFARPECQPTGLPESQPGLRPKA